MTSMISKKSTASA